MRLHSPFRRLLPVLLAIGAGFATRPAHGGWSYSYVTNGNGTKIAEVAEQIFYTGNPTLCYDYEYQVANISPTRASINGFELYVGSQTNLVSQPLFPLGPVPSYRGYSLYFGGIPNASSTFSPAREIPFPQFRGGSPSISATRRGTGSRGVPPHCRCRITTTPNSISSARIPRFPAAGPWILSAGPAAWVLISRGVAAFSRPTSTQASRFPAARILRVGFRAFRLTVLFPSQPRSSSSPVAYSR